MQTDMLKPTDFEPLVNFVTWAKTAPAGEKYNYWEGFICKDRDKESPGNKDKDCELPDMIAKAAWKMYQKGTVFLVQRKLGIDAYQYIAIKRAKG
jgi:hypothetical protein